MILANTILPVALLLIPLSIGFSILRYRLYDIDVLINRTLVYGTLTLLLALLYVGLVLGLQFLFDQIAGSAAADSPSDDTEDWEAVFPGIEVSISTLQLIYQIMSGTPIDTLKSRFTSNRLYAVFVNSGGT